VNTIENIGEAFSRQSESYDLADRKNVILQWMRQQVYSHCIKYFHPGEKILELNCGTGIDAIYFAEKGLKVHATDISDGMLAELRRKIEIRNLQRNITPQKLSFFELNVLPQRSYNHVFSNFGGLNCTKDIDQVILQFKNLLTPGGTVTLVMMPPFCPWEIALALKGNFKTAFRRLRKEGTDSNVEGILFKSYYYSPSTLIAYFGKNYRVKELRGLASLVPPPYLENIPIKYPGIFKSLQKADAKLSHRYPFNRWADHFILTMQLQD
jgi:ubiquinone/menaquinone biosynthesis C-methylase UbiE